MKIQPCMKTYRDRCVLSFPGLELKEGKIYALIGSNGSGKSTFGKILSGVLSADHKSAPLCTGKVGYMPQNSFAFRMTTRKNILLGGSDKEKAERLMQELQLTALADKRADRLSGGETARMALARLMMNSYDLLILDEPTAAMDMETSLLAEKVIASYVQKTGCSLLLITHSLSQAGRLADELLFFHNGQLKENGPSERLLSTPSTDELKRFLNFYGGV